MRQMPRSKTVPAMLGAAALLTATLAGCTAIPGFGGCTPIHPEGGASSLVTADGALGSSPDVEFPTPLVAKSPQVSVIEAGDGELVESGAQAEITLTTLFGADGQDVTGQLQSGLIAAGTEGQVLSEALVCAHVGDRLALVSSSALAFGEGGGAQFNLEDDDTVVMVLDVTGVYLGKADGFNQLPQDGMPTVVTEVDGTPGVSTLLQTPPASTRSSVIKAGDGAVVRAGDQLIAQYSIFTWPESGQPEFVGGSWDRGAQILPLTEETGIPQGWLDAVVGQRIGSQILVVLAPGDGSFSEESAPAGVDATYIVVVDLLGIQDSGD